MKAAVFISAPRCVTHCHIRGSMPRQSQLFFCFSYTLKIPSVMISLLAVLGDDVMFSPKYLSGASEPRTACFSLKRSTFKAIFFFFTNIWWTCQKWNMPNNHITHEGEWDLVPFTMTIHALVFCHSWGVNMINDTDVANTSCVFFFYSYFSTYVIHFLWLV